MQTFEEENMTEKEKLLKFAVNKLKSLKADEFMAHWLSFYQQDFKLSDQEHAEELGIDKVEKYYLFMLCKCPNPKDSNFDDRIDYIVSNYPCNKKALITMINYGFKCQKTV